MARNAAGLPAASGMACFPAVTNRSATAVVTLLVSHGADLGTVPSFCQPPSHLFAGGCHQDVGGLPKKGGQGCFPSLRAALSFPTDGRQHGQCRCLLGWRDVCLLSCRPTTPLSPRVSPREGQGLLCTPEVAQGWLREGKACLENACKPLVCSLVPTRSGINTDISG